MEWTVAVAVPVGRVGNCRVYGACGQAVGKVWAACCPWLIHNLSIGGMAVIHAVHREPAFSEVSTYHVQFNCFCCHCSEATVKYFGWLLVSNGFMRTLIIVLSDIVINGLSQRLRCAIFVRI